MIGIVVKSVDTVDFDMVNCTGIMEFVGVFRLQMEVCSHCIFP